MKIAILTDAWHPQLSGVVRTIEATVDELEKLGHTVLLITPEDFQLKVCLPTYPEIRIPLFPNRLVYKKLREFCPDVVHIATEGTIGLAGRRWCVRRKFPFSTAIHTRFPEYLHERTGISVDFGYRFMRWCHKPAIKVMVATTRLKEEMEMRGFRNLVLWSRGVDTSLFKPSMKEQFQEPKPHLLYFGRVSVEKNIEAFLSLDVSGTKYVVGDGPDLHRLQSLYPDVHFLGKMIGSVLAETVSAADVMVFPSKTDTFGLVVLEANACGVPVACYPVQGPGDQIINGYNGFASDDLVEAINKCLLVDKLNCIEHAREYTWERVTRQFIENLVLR